MLQPYTRKRESLLDNATPFLSPQRLSMGEMWVMIRPRPILQFPRRFLEIRPFPPLCFFPLRSDSV
jgi:hypothetical protein